jgi:FixJ family two-component response regulator
MTQASPLVYLIDDDAYVRESVADLLTSIGLEVKPFQSAREFLASKRPETPSCLVLDVRLPGLSGLDFQQELLKAHIHIPIIFITGHGDIPMSVKAMKAGAAEFLTKPFRDQDLIDAVQHALDLDRSQRRQKLVMATANRHKLRPAAYALAALAILLAAVLVGPGIVRRRVAAKKDTSNISRLSAANAAPGGYEGRITGHVEVPVQAALTSATVANVPEHGTQWYLNAISADKVKLTDLSFPDTPEVAVIGVVDSGVDVTHPLIKPIMWSLPPELATPYWPSGSIGFDFFENRPNPVDELEDSHGTHVTGLVTGRQLAVWLPLFDEAGLARNVKAFSLKITGADGSFDFTAAQNAIEAGITNNIRIFNLSLFGPYSQLLQQDLARAERRNSTLFVVAAGNDGEDLDTSLEYHRTFRNEDGSGLANVIFVAALADTGKVAEFSNWGKLLVQIAAPGVQISSTIRGAKFGTLSGSSQAAPIVTFTAAILKAEKPDLVPVAIKNRILETCDWDDKLKDQVANGCKLNLLKAVVCGADLLELRNGTLLRGDIDRSQFFRGLPVDASLVRVWIPSPRVVTYVYASGKRESNSLKDVSIAIKLHFGETCSSELVSGVCSVQASEVKDVVFRLK